VGVSVPTEDDHVLVRIADNGPGIPTTKKNGSSARASAVARAGTGMGLSLVETLVKQYDGEVWVEDNEPTGAIFVVKLGMTDVAPEEWLGSHT